MTSLDLAEAAPSSSTEVAPDLIRACDGFRVMSSEGYVGAVELVLYGASRRPAALAVRAGIFARRLMLVPVEEVRSVRLAKRTITLADSWRPAEACLTEELE
jgi:hypothetical protein